MNKTLFFVLFAFWLLLSSCAWIQNTPSHDLQSSDAPIQITAAAPIADKTSEAYTLSDLYQNDRKLAESLEGKVIEITGTVENVTNNRSIYLDRESTIGYIICALSDDDPTDTAMIKKGDRVKIVGTLKGSYGHISIKDCWFIEAVID